MSLTTGSVLARNWKCDSSISIGGQKCQKCLVALVRVLVSCFHPSSPFTHQVKKHSHLAALHEILHEPVKVHLKLQSRCQDGEVQKYLGGKTGLTTTSMPEPSKALLTPKSKTLSKPILEPAFVNRELSLLAFS